MPQLTQEHLDAEFFDLIKRYNREEVQIESLIDYLHRRDATLARSMAISPDHIVANSAPVIVVGKRMTPAEEAADFFEKGAVYDDILAALAARGSRDAVERELQKFILYWTEKNKTGTRERWQQEKTFEVRRRLYTWLSRASERKGGVKTGRQIV